MQNKTPTGGEKFAVLLETATRERAAKLPGVEVASTTKDNADRKLPVVVIEGAVRKLSHATHGSEVAVSAEVEFILKRESALKASLSGRAKATGDGSDSARLESLHEAALLAAVESALKTPETVLVALR